MDGRLLWLALWLAVWLAMWWSLAVSAPGMYRSPQTNSCSTTTCDQQATLSPSRPQRYRKC